MAGYHSENISHSVSVEAYIEPACHWLTRSAFGDINMVTNTVVSCSVHRSPADQHDLPSPQPAVGRGLGLVHISG